MLLLLLLTTLVPWASAATCADGCEIDSSLILDDNCDCSECEDENAWSCYSCGGCPEACGDSVVCEEQPDFICDDGCTVPALFVEDDWCDCLDCEEESLWTCESCGSCPTECGGYEECVTSYFICDDNCTIADTKQNDGFCDCGWCEDEDDYTCESCGGCPAECGDSAIDCVPPFVCDDGCEIEASFADDDYCDCSECEDESAWTCASCGGCPTECGSYEECSLQTSTMAPFETSTSTTTEEPTEAEDGAATVRLLLAAVLGLLSAIAL